MTRKYRKKTERQKLVQELDITFSKWIKLTKSDENGRCTCVTCGSRKRRDSKNMQNGHYLSRKFYKRRYSSWNCRPQCKSCNVFKHGNYQRYKSFMLYMMLGEKGMKPTKENLGKVLAELDHIETVETKKVFKMPIQTLREMLDWYTGQVMELEKRKGKPHRKR